jgi:hypothetical protein
MDYHSLSRYMGYYDYSAPENKKKEKIREAASPSVSVNADALRESQNRHSRTSRSLEGNHQTAFEGIEGKNDSDLDNAILKEAVELQQYAGSVIEI